MQHKMSRRAIVKRGLLAGALMPAMGLISKGAEAAGLPPLDPNDAQAKSLGFVPVASKVDAAANPTYKAGQPEVRHLRAVPGQGGRRQRRLQCVRRPQRSSRRLVQGLGGEDHLTPGRGCRAQRRSIDLMPRNAWRMRLSFSIRAKRT